jgi:hypothetical protein
LIKHWTIAALLITALAGASFAESKHCDRACMIALTDQYLAALVKHDPAGLPLSRGVRFTENTAEIRIGDGLWVGASEAPSTFKIYAVDPASSQVGFYGVMKENNRPLIIALRLKVVDGKINRDRARARSKHAPGSDAKPGDASSGVPGRRASRGAHSARRHDQRSQFLF